MPVRDALRAVLPRVRAAQAKRLGEGQGARVGPSHGNVAQSQRPLGAPGHGDDREITRIANAAADDHVARRSAPFSVAAAIDRGDADEVTPIAASAQNKIARGEFLLALEGRRLVHRTLDHREIDEIPIRHAQHAAHVRGGDGEVSQCHDQRLLSSKGSLFPPTTGVAVNIVCGELDPKIRHIQPDSLTP